MSCTVEICYVVSSAGCDTCNGTYKLDGTHQGRPKYRKVDQNGNWRNPSITSTADPVIYSGVGGANGTQTVWRMSAKGSLTGWDYSMRIDSDEPPTGRWTEGPAKTPHPTVTAVPVSTADAAIVASSAARLLDLAMSERPAALARLSTDPEAVARHSATIAQCLVYPPQQANKDWNACAAALRALRTSPEAVAQHHAAIARVLEYDGWKLNCRTDEAINLSKIEVLQTLGASSAAVAQHLELVASFLTERFFVNDTLRPVEMSKMRIYHGSFTEDHVRKMRIAALNALATLPEAVAQYQEEIALQFGRTKISCPAGDLTRVWDDAETVTREAALKALSTSKEAVAAQQPAIALLLCDRSEAIRTAAEALLHNPAEAVAQASDAIARLLDSQFYEARRAALRVLARSPKAKAKHRAAMRATEEFLAKAEADKQRQEAKPCCVWERNARNIARGWCDGDCDSSCVFCDHGPGC